MVVGFIPFFYKPEALVRSLAKSILFPLLATLLFLVIAVITQIEELLCFIIIGIPYIVVSILVSLILRAYQKNKRDASIHKNYIPPLLLFPLLFSAVEKEFKVDSHQYITSTAITIQKEDAIIWNNLHAVPNISGLTQTSLVNALGIPKPILSTYDPVKNIRLGYFDNGMVLHEKVVTEKQNKKLSFAIDFEKSVIKQSPTLINVIKEKSIVFEEISYELKPIHKNKTLVTLYCKYNIQSNLQWYGHQIVDLILADFEATLLQSLKQKLEKL